MELFGSNKPGDKDALDRLRSQHADALAALRAEHGIELAKRDSELAALRSSHDAEITKIRAGYESRLDRMRHRLARPAPGQPAPEPDQTAARLSVTVTAALNDKRIDSKAMLAFVLEPIVELHGDDFITAEDEHAARRWVDLAVTAFRPRAKAKPAPKPVAILPTPAEVARNAAIARGEVLQMPADELARKIILAGRRRRGEEPESWEPKPL